ncbi:MAG: hypothetical protein ABI557_05170 [Aureliella sp.]
MAIPVTCPSCLKRFNVSDKFAGKSGPCPSCKKTIRIPEKTEEVVIHAPDEAAPKDPKGRSILKPIRRTEVNLSLPVILAASLSSVVVFGIALGIGLSGGAPNALLVIAALLLAVPLVFVGYWFLHDDELDSFRGRELLIRCGVCAIVFASTWGLYAYLPSYLTGEVETDGMQIAMLLPVMIALGTIAAVLAFELEILQGLLLYAFYLVTTFTLAWLAGAPLMHPREAKSTAPAPPAISQPANKPSNSGKPGPATPTKPAAPTPPESTPAVPKLLQ